MSLFVPSVLSGSEEIINKNRKIERIENKNRYLGFAKYDECIEFLQEIGIKSCEEVKKSCEELDISIKQFLIVKFVELCDLEKFKIIRLFSIGTKFLKDRKDDFEDHLSKVSYQIFEQNGLLSEDPSIHAMNCIDLIKNILAKKQPSTQEKQKEIGSKGEKFVMELEKLKKNNANVTRISQIDEKRGYDIEVTKKNGEKTLIEVKTSVNNIENATAHVNFKQWKMSTERNNYYFYFFLLKEKKLAILSAKKINHHIPAMSLQKKTLDDLNQWKEYVVYFKTFKKSFKTVSL